MRRRRAPRRVKPGQTLGPSPLPLLQASSPDEEALVQGAAYLGYTLASRTTETVVLERARGGGGGSDGGGGGPSEVAYDVLAVLEFNSDRRAPLRGACLQAGVWQARKGCRWAGAR